MENQNNVEQSNVEVSKNIYNISQSKKTTDFLLGFLGIIICSIAVIFADLYIGNMFINAFVGVVFLTVSFIAIILYVIFKFIKTDRRYISIGIISAVVGFLLIFGSCILIVTNII